MKVDEKDLVITYYKSSGPGGQKKNKTASAVRIKHLPTGILVTANESRSQHENREKALERLLERLSAGQRRRKKRIPTKVGKAAREKRLTQKKRRGEVKQLRRSPES